MVYREEPTDRFAAIARALDAEATEVLTLDKAVAVAVDLVDGCDHAGVTLVHEREGRVETAAATSDMVARGDQLQFDLGEGPCMGLIRDHDTVSSPDLQTEERWPQWAPLVVGELGMRSLQCYQLFTTGQSYGALNLYSKIPKAFDYQDQTAGLALAAHIAVALAAARNLDDSALALVRRTTIGQAEGILMERFDLSAEHSFALLRQAAQQQKRKLFEIAQEVINTRRKPSTT